MAGIGSGTLLFSILYPLLEGFYKTSDMGAVTLPDLLGMNHWVLLAIVYAFAGFMFYTMERYERRSPFLASKKVMHAVS
jgi:hypothetical protein